MDQLVQEKQIHHLKAFPLGDAPVLVPTFQEVALVKIDLPPQADKFGRTELPGPFFLQGEISLFKVDQVHTPTFGGRIEADPAGLDHQVTSRSLTVFLEDRLQFPDRLAQVFFRLGWQRAFPKHLRQTFAEKHSPPINEQITQQFLDFIRFDSLYGPAVSLHFKPSKDGHIDFYHLIASFGQVVRTETAWNTDNHSYIMVFIFICLSPGLPIRMDLTPNTSWGMPGRRAPVYRRELECHAGEELRSIWRSRGQIWEYWLWRPSAIEPVLKTHTPSRAACARSSGYRGRSPGGKRAMPSGRKPVRNWRRHICGSPIFERMPCIRPPAGWREPSQRWFGRPEREWHGAEPSPGASDRRYGILRIQAADGV